MLLSDKKLENSSLLSPAKKGRIMPRAVGEKAANQGEPFGHVQRINAGLDEALEP